VLEERLGSASTAERRYVWGIKGIDDLILRDRIDGGTERLYALSDGMSVTAVVNTSGTVQERYGYTGFGVPRYMTASFGSRSSSDFDWETLFHAYRRDSETGFYQVRYRYLHPNLGRWLNRDPIEEQGGLNLYAFVGNDPVNHWDYFGLRPSACDNIRNSIASLQEQQRAALREIDFARRLRDGYIASAGLDPIDWFGAGADFFNDVVLSLASAASPHFVALDLGSSIATTLNASYNIDSQGVLEGLGKIALGAYPLGIAANAGTFKGAATRAGWYGAAGYTAISAYEHLGDPFRERRERQRVNNNYNAQIKQNEATINRINEVLKRLGEEWARNNCGKCCS
jgi:RHS repeat-associated protein